MTSVLILGSKNKEAGPANLETASHCLALGSEKPICLAFERGYQSICTTF